MMRYVNDILQIATLKLIVQINLNLKNKSFEIMSLFIMHEWSTKGHEYLSLNDWHGFYRYDNERIHKREFL